MARGNSIPVQKSPSEAGYAGEGLKVEVLREQPVGEALYWFGALPCEGKRKIEIPVNSEDFDLNQIDEVYRGMGDLTAFQAWFPDTWVKNKAIRLPSRWLGRCKYLQNIGVTGLEFPVFTEEVISEMMNEGRQIRVAWPGSVAKFTDLQMDSILASVKNHAIRPATDGRTAHIINYTGGHMEGCKGAFACTCAAIEKALPDTVRLDPQLKRYGEVQFPRRGDMPMADFVYIRRLSEPVSTPRTEFYSLVPGMEQFLKNPPPPLSKSIEEAKVAAVA